MSLAGILRAVAHACPERVFLDDGRRCYTYAQVWNQSVAVAGWLRQNVPTPQSRILLAGSSTAETVAALFGINLAGATTVIPSCPARLNGNRTEEPRHVPAAVIADVRAAESVWVSDGTGPVLSLSAEAVGNGFNRPGIHDLENGFPEGEWHTPPETIAVEWDGPDERAPFGRRLSNGSVLELTPKIVRKLQLADKGLAWLGLPFHEPTALLALSSHASCGAEVLLDSSGAGQEPVRDCDVLWLTEQNLRRLIDDVPGWDGWREIPHVVACNVADGTVLDRAARMIEGSLFHVRVRGKPELGIEVEEL